MALVYKNVVIKIYIEKYSMRCRSYVDNKINSKTTHPENVPSAICFDSLEGQLAINHLFEALSNVRRCDARQFPQPAAVCLGHPAEDEVPELPSPLWCFRLLHCIYDLFVELFGTFRGF